MQTQPTPSWKLLRAPMVIAITSYSRASIYRPVREGKFPPPVKLGNGQGGAVAWRSDEIFDWVKTRQEGRAWSQ
ncbi:MAG: AlpA family phage regulatory protein [Clostridia bacterium]|nr:AlpA family phage regulatory protein [Clostridia bacterium]